MEYAIGTLVSMAVEIFKAFFPNAPQWVKLLAVLVLSLISAAVYNYFISVGMWESVAKIIISAGAFYSFIIRTTKQ